MKVAFNAEKYVRMLTYVPIVDDSLATGIHLIISVLGRTCFAAKDEQGTGVDEVVAMLAIAAAIEHRKVFVLKA